MIDINSLSWNERLRLLRAVKDWSQEKAADMCGTQQKTYWDWEKGKRFPHKNNRKAIANAFGVTEADIFGESLKGA